MSSFMEKFDIKSKAKTTSADANPIDSAEANGGAKEKDGQKSAPPSTGDASSQKGTLAAHVAAKVRERS